MEFYFTNALAESTEELTRTLSKICAAGKDEAVVGEQEQRWPWWPCLGQEDAMEEDAMGSIIAVLFFGSFHSGEITGAGASSIRGRSTRDFRQWIAGRTHSSCR